MSYCRFSPDSNVYLYPHVDDYIECCACRLKPEGEWFGNFRLDAPSDAIDHLNRHIAAGHQVPARAFERLKQEIAQNK